MTAGRVHVAAVVLNHDSTQDLMVSGRQLLAQEGVRLSLIVVDNASDPFMVDALRAWAQEVDPRVIVGAEGEVIARIRQGPPTRDDIRSYLVLSNRNGGYSAGNNIGIRIARELGADAVLIANPDVRIEDRRYAHALASELLRHPDQAVAASRVVDLDGRDQNPMREATFWEELLWPRFVLRRWIPAPEYVLPVPADRPTAVPKVAGCCVMLSSRFLAQIGALDEGVFLYCEEAILSAQVRAQRARTIFVPWLCAVHAHVPSTKGRHAERMLQFIRSRIYYLRRYSSYPRARRLLLELSWGLLGLIHRARRFLAR